MKRILTLLTVIFCLSSCEKEQKHWLSKTWYGEYGTQVQNNDTGEYTTVTACISLDFNADRSECLVTGAYSGLLSSNRIKYYAEVYDDTKAFSLRKYPGDVEIKYVSEVVSGKRILKWREGNEERTVVINALLLE